MNDIFISYKREEQGIAQKLADSLKRIGWSVWWDQEIITGHRYDDVIGEAINNAKCVIVLWSKLSIESKYIKNEASYASQQNKLLPVAIDDVKLPFPFHSLHVTPLVDWDGSNSSPEFQKLFTDIVRITGEPPINKRESGLGKKLKIKQKTHEKNRRNYENKQKHDAVPNTYTNSLGMKFVLIPAGRFMMGSHISPEETVQKYGLAVDHFNNEHPKHAVTISKAFYLQSTAVTQGQWKKVMGDNPSDNKSCGDKCPVERVSWKDTQKFIKKLNEIAISNSYRLPTEAEWEYACRAGTTTDFSFGDDPNDLDKYVWCAQNSGKLLHPVGMKRPNVWGLYDMHGNVSEWVEDSWHNNYKGAPTNGSAWVGKISSVFTRVRRGSSYLYFGYSSRSAGRSSGAPGNHEAGVGFRLAMSIGLNP